LPIALFKISFDVLRVQRGKFRWGNLLEGGHLEDGGGGKRITLKWI